VGLDLGHEEDEQRKREGEGGRGRGRGRGLGFLGWIKIRMSMGVGHKVWT
jgi:hypothetical protein